MTTEWFAECKDCRDEYGYSDSSYQLSKRRGDSRPERCAKHRRLHSREISTLGLSHFDMSPVLPIPPGGLEGGSLGKLVRAERIHRPTPRKSTFDFDKFGIKDHHIQEYFEIMLKYQVTVVVAPTGAGKSTLLPFRLMEPPHPYPNDLWTKNGQIIVTQPRKQATRNIPDFVAGDLHASSLGAGFDIGFRHSGNPATDHRNKLVYMTDGTLINMIIRNEIGRLSVIMIDEAHERSLNIDLILGLLKAQLPKYPHLKLIIASATIKASKFLNYYGAPEDVNPDDPQFKLEDEDGNQSYDNQALEEVLAGFFVGFYGFPGKRKHPVDTRYRSSSDPIPLEQFSRRMPEAAAEKAFEVLMAMEGEDSSDLTTIQVEGVDVRIKGDILIFLQGEKPILRAVELLSGKIDEEPRLSEKVDVLPLFTKLVQSEQDKALKEKQDKDRYRVVISTNVAETSLTVEGIVHVIDSSLINESQWDPKTQTSFVVPKPHSQSGCQQRWGRAGRVEPGIAHCLYTKEQFKEEFERYTFPEIVRAPIDQLVLTAKAAGIDNIATFDWIEAPSKSELARAPIRLKQIGALDEEGDLTEHGLELRFFPEEIEIANLMILADRFGCAVEMATLLPMLKLGGYSKLLTWDRSWDAHTKRSVNRIHKGLIEPCLDDVEFYLKLWEVWDGSIFGRGKEAQRQQWARQFFVNHDVLEAVRAERKDLIKAISGHKKDDVIRPIDFELLTRIRIVITYGLPNQIYRLENRPWDNGKLAEEEAIYKPHIANPEKYPELVELHRDATVRISDESVCFGRKAPEYFVCGKRTRYRVYKSPMEEPETVISAAFISLFDPAWLEIVEKKTSAVVRLIAAEAGKQAKTDFLLGTLNRIFIDQFFPINATYTCEVAEDGATATLGNILDTPFKITTSSSHEEAASFDQIELLDTEGDLSGSPSRKIEESSVQISPVDEEEDDIPIWTYLLAEDDDAFANSNSKISRQIFTSAYRPQGEIVQSAASIPKDQSSKANIYGYDISDIRRPRLKLKVPIEPDPFERFRELYEPGSDIKAEIVAVERYVNDKLSYLILREQKTLLELVLDPNDASLIGRNFSIDYLNKHIGETITATVEDIAVEKKHVRVTRLKTAEAQMLRYMGKESEKIVDASISDIGQIGINLWLSPADTQAFMPIGGFVFNDDLPNRPSEIQLGASCTAKVSLKNWKKPISRMGGDLPAEIAERFERMEFGDHLRWDEGERKLSVHGRRMTYEQRRKLLALWEAPEYQRAVNILFRRSNQFDTKLIDVTGGWILAELVEQKEPALVSVVTIDEKGALVEAEGGYRTWLPAWKLGHGDPQEVVESMKPGDKHNLYVYSIDPIKGELDASLLRPEDHPVLEYRIGNMVFGVVKDFGANSDAAYVQLKPGFDGYLHISEAGIGKPEKIQDVLEIGEVVHARVISVDVERGRLRLSLNKLHEKEVYIPILLTYLVIGENGETIQTIEGDTETSLHIEDEYCQIQGPTSKAVNTAAEMVETIIGEAQIIQIQLEHQLQVSRLIGSGGKVINAIRDDTGARIELDSDTQVVKVIAGDSDVLQETLLHIRNAISFILYTGEIGRAYVGRVIGGGETIRDIQKQSNSHISFPEKGSGVFTIEAVDQAEIDQAVRLIEQIAGSVDPIEIRQYSLPVYETLTPISPHIRPPKSVSIEKTQAIPQELVDYFGEERIERQKTHIDTSAEGRPGFEILLAQFGTEGDAAQVVPAEYVHAELPVTKDQMDTLTAKQGDAFARFFGIDQSELQIIQSETGAAIILDQTLGKIQISALSPSAVEIATERIKQRIS